MRRSDREVTDGNKIDAVINACHCCRLAFCDRGEPYIVPLNFGFENRDGRRVFYFHGAGEGRKAALIRRTHRAGFELDTGYRLIEGDRACGYSAAFVSVVGTGVVTFVEEAGEKVAALRSVMAHATGQGGWEFTEDMMRTVCVFKLEVEKISCKEHK